MEIEKIQQKKYIFFRKKGNSFIKKSKNPTIKFKLNCSITEWQLSEQKVRRSPLSPKHELA